MLLIILFKRIPNRLFQNFPYTHNVAVPGYSHRQLRGFRREEHTAAHVLCLFEPVGRVAQNMSKKGVCDEQETQHVRGNSWEQRQYIVYIKQGIRRKNFQNTVIYRQTFGIIESQNKSNKTDQVSKIFKITFKKILTIAFKISCTTFLNML